MAGKRGKCPACGGVIKVKGPAAAAGSVVSTTASEKIRVACACGKALAVPASYAGKKVKCPGCGNAVAVPGPGASPPMGVARPAEPPKVTGPAKGPAAVKGNPKAPPKSVEADPNRKPLHDRHDCPGCGQFVSFFDALCLECGTNIVTGVKSEMKILEPDKTLMERLPWKLIGKISAGVLLAVGGFLGWWLFVRTPQVDLLQLVPEDATLFLRMHPRALQRIAELTPQSSTVLQPFLATDAWKGTRQIGLFARLPEGGDATAFLDSLGSITSWDTHAQQIVSGMSIVLVATGSYRFGDLQAAFAALQRPGGGGSAFPEFQKFPIQGGDGFQVADSSHEGFLGLRVRRGASVLLADNNYDFEPAVASLDETRRSLFLSPRCEMMELMARGCGAPSFLTMGIVLRDEHRASLARSSEAWGAVRGILVEISDLPGDLRVVLVCADGAGATRMAKVCNDAKEVFAPRLPPGQVASLSVVAAGNDVTATLPITQQMLDGLNVPPGQ